MIGNHNVVVKELHGGVVPILSHPCAGDEVLSSSRRSFVIGYWRLMSRKAGGYNYGRRRRQRWELEMVDRVSQSSEEIVVLITLDGHFGYQGVLRFARL